MRRKIVLAVVYSLYLLLLFEFFSRALWHYTQEVPFLKPQQIFYGFYPGLYDLTQADISNQDDVFDILLLGGSVLHPDFGNVGAILDEQLSYQSGMDVQVHNLAWRAHTSLDSWLKYERLQEQHFDLVVFYHGINELRANHIPPELFQPDYSHFAWYQRIYALDDHPELPYFTLPYTVEHLLLLAEELSPSTTHISPHQDQDRWMSYGSEIKTVPSFQANLTKILDLAGEKGDPVLLMTFVYYIPEGYSLVRFEAHETDYALHLFPVEHWGEPANVEKGLKAHNHVVEPLAQEYNTLYVDQGDAMPQAGYAFNDVVHFTYAGALSFVENMTPEILKVMERRVP